MENRKYTENIWIWLRRFPGRILTLPDDFVELHIQRKMNKKKKGSLQFSISIRIERKYKETRIHGFKKKATFHSQTLKTVKRSQYKRQPQRNDHLKDETEIFFVDTSERFVGMSHGLSQLDRNAFEYLRRIVS